MDDKDEVRPNRAALKALMKSAGYVARRLGEGYLEVPFGGKYRDWDIRANNMNGWLTASIYFFALPVPGPIRAALYERVLQLNDTMSACKFTRTGDMLTLDLQYRIEHVDAEVMQNLFGLMIGLCESHYPELFRIVSGDETLANLEAAFTRHSLPGGVE